MSRFQSKYTFELWSPGGILLADLSGRAANRKIIQSRNEAEDITWSLDLNDWEQYCRAINQHPRNLLITGQTEVRVRRQGKYLCGGQLMYAYPYITPTSQTLTLRANGFLNLFGSRYTGTTNAGSVTETYSAVNGGTIASTLLTQTQAKTNGDFGVTIGSIANTGVHNRNYQGANIKEALQDFTKVQTNPFDIEFTYNKVFNTYASIGSNRPDIIFEFPNNILEVGVPNDATGLANAILAKGQGVGTALATYEADNSAAQTQYKLREKVITSNATDNTDNGLTDAANSELATWANPFEIPNLMVDGNVAPYITDYGIGDRARVRLKGYRTLEHIDGMYRIEQTTLMIDEQDNESIIVKVSI